MSLLTHIERWRDIEGYEGLYKVSTCGRVKSLNYNHTDKEIILKTYKNNGGYLRVCLSKDGKVKQYLVHRLVAQAFIPNPLNLPCVNHKTEDKTINYCCCIEWCDYLYNNRYGSRNERISKKLVNNEKISKKVLCVETNITYESVNEASRQTGFDKGNISKCCIGKSKTVGGFHWKYID